MIVLGLGRSLSKFSAGKAPAPPYQLWTAQPATTLLTADYPYQYLWENGGSVYLIVSAGKFYVSGGQVTASTTSRFAQKSGDAWGAFNSLPSGYAWGDATKITQANNDIYTSVAFAAVYFAKTT